MNCHRYDDQLDAYVDGARPAEFQAHLAGCARCQALVADFTRIRQVTATLEEQAPPPALWTKIAASIDERRARRWWAPFTDARSGWAPVAVAASLVLLVGGTGWLVSRQGPAAPTEAVRQNDETIDPAEQHYDDAIRGLQRIVEAQDPALDPGTRAVLQRNLAVIDHAIDESRAALSAEPASALAQESLLDALDTKVSLLQDTVTLAGELDEASTTGGAAEELNQ